jgi:2-hydroxychromene-2-carboxylate isomerase
MFDFMELLYFNQGTENTGWLSDATVKAAVAALPGLDVPKLLAARSSAAVKAQEQRFDAQASADAVNQTPTILVGKSGGKLQQVALSSPTDEASVAAAVRKALA